MPAVRAPACAVAIPLILTLAAPVLAVEAAVMPSSGGEAAPAGETASTGEAAAATPSAAPAPSGAWTVYAGRMSSEKAWQDILLGPTHVSFTDTDLAVLAHSRALPWSYGGFAWEIEGQVAKYRGGQDHWEFNAPVVARWTRFPWSARLATAASFALGLSYATETPPVEVELEGESQRLLVYWFIELAAGPPDAAWSVVTRLHHRSVAFGLMGDEGGMNAVTVGLRWEF